MHTHAYKYLAPWMQRQKDLESGPVFFFAQVGVSCVRVYVCVFTDRDGTRTLYAGNSAAIISLHSPVTMPDLVQHPVTCEHVCVCVCVCVYIHIFV